MKQFEYTNEPKIIHETEDYAIVYKPSGLPTAPLQADEENVLLTWFLHQRPEAKNVIGRKEIEAGLLHRLDTATYGLVLIAKNQQTFDKLLQFQSLNKITKTYVALCSYVTNKEIQNFALPYTITSQFRPFGPKGKIVLPLFYGMRQFDPYKKLYSTTLTSLEQNDEYLKITCMLTKGYRHQIRSHLSYLGFPIYGDILYNDKFKTAEPVEQHNYPLQLFATGISFPHISNNNDFTNYLSFSIPSPKHIIKA